MNNCLTQIILIVIVYTIYTVVVPIFIVLNKKLAGEELSFKSIFGEFVECLKGIFVFIWAILIILIIGIIGSNIINSITYNSRQYDLYVNHYTDTIIPLNKEYCKRYYSYPNDFSACVIRQNTKSSKIRYEYVNRKWNFVLFGKPIF